MEINVKKDIAERVLIMGDEYRNNAPGGIAAVLQYYRPYFESFKYIPTFKSGKFLDKVIYVGLGPLKLCHKLLFDRKIELLHIHTAADGSFWMNRRFIRIAKYFGKKVILHIHGSRFKDFYNEQEDKSKIIEVLSLVDKLIVLSESWKDWFLSLGIDERKIVILHNITAYPVRIPKDNKKKVINFLFLGEIGDRKGIFDVLKVIKNNLDRYKGRLMLYIGGNKQEEKLNNYIILNNLKEIVKFEGFVFGKKKQELLNNADVFILVSKNEGLPISILEAMSYGCAIISTPVGGIPEVVRQGENGILVEPANLDQIAQAIDILLDVKIIGRMADRSLEMVKPYYPNYVIEHLISVYNEIFYKN